MTEVRGLAREKKNYKKRSQDTTVKRIETTATSQHKRTEMKQTKKENRENCNNWILNVHRIEFVDSSVFDFEADKISAADTENMPE